MGFEVVRDTGLFLLREGVRGAVVVSFSSLVCTTHVDFWSFAAHSRSRNDLIPVQASSPLTDPSTPLALLPSPHPILLRLLLSRTVASPRLLQPHPNLLRRLGCPRTSRRTMVSRDAPKLGNADEYASED